MKGAWPKNENSLNKNQQETRERFSGPHMSSEFYAQPAGNIILWTSNLMTSQIIIFGSSIIEFAFLLSTKRVLMKSVHRVSGLISTLAIRLIDFCVSCENHAPDPNNCI